MGTHSTVVSQRENCVHVDPIGSRLLPTYQEQIFCKRTGHKLEGIVGKIVALGLKLQPKLGQGEVQVSFFFHYKYQQIIPTGNLEPLQLIDLSIWASS